jgi:hypothetical protein
MNEAGKKSRKGFCGLSSLKLRHFFVIQHSSFVIPISSFVIPISSVVLRTSALLNFLEGRIGAANPIARLIDLR